LIFGGDTDAVHPRLPPGPLLQYLHSHNHWSNGATTLLLWKQFIIPHIEARRRSLGQPAAPAIVLADAFAAHWTAEIKEFVSQQDAIAYIAIPDCLTHLFQPLDLGIIAALKNSILRRKDDFMEHEVRMAVKEGRGVVLSNSRVVLRERVAAWVKEAVSDPIICAEKCCRTGFARAGVTRALFGDSEVAPDVDNFVPGTVCDDCGEPAFKIDEFPPCAHFGSVVSAALCSGCLDNHMQLCEPV